jgi:AcrR family transcriptional regulator
LSTASAPGRSDRPLRADARRNRARIIEAASAAFAESGTELPMEEIARRAGVGIGTVYRHFPNKEALLDAILVDQLIGRIERTQRALAEDGAWDAFRNLVRESADWQAGDLAFCEVVMEWKSMSRSSEVDARRVELESEMATLIERAQAEGRMRSDFTVDDVPTMFASIAGAIRSSDEEAWRRHVEFVLDGLRA